MKMPNTRAMLLMAIALALTPAAQAYERTLTSDGAYLYSFAAGSVMITSTTGDVVFDNSLRQIEIDGNNVRITGTFELQPVTRDETSERYLTSTALDLLFGLTPTAGGVLSINAGGVGPKPATPIRLFPGGQISLDGVVSGRDGSGFTEGIISGSIQIGSRGDLSVGHPEVPVASIPVDISLQGGIISLRGSGGIAIEGATAIGISGPIGTLPPGALQLTLLPAVPEPSSALMLALGGLALAGVIARRRRV